MTGGQAWNLFIVVLPGWVFLPGSGIFAILFLSTRAARKENRRNADRP